MNIEIQKASNLGPLHKKLNIDPDARVSVKGLDIDGMHVWDLSTGNYFVLNPLVTPMTFEKSHVQVPDWAVEIIQMPDDQLSAKWQEYWYEDDLEKLMVVQTELGFRGISTLRGR